MEAVSGGTQKLTMNSADRDYESKLRAAKAQTQNNPFVEGIQTVFKEGAGEEVKKSRTSYGAVQEMPQEVLEGQYSNFAQNDNPGNSDYGQMVNTTGNADDQVSSTIVPQEDPADFQTDALQERLQMYANAGKGFPGLNDRSQVTTV